MRVDACNLKDGVEDDVKYLIPLDAVELENVNMIARPEIYTLVPFPDFHLSPSHVRSNMHWHMP